MSRVFLATVLVAVVALVVPPAAARAQPVRVLVDGETAMFDQPPVVTGGRVLVPLRGVFEQLGAFVQWNAATGAVFATGAGNQVQLTIGSRRAVVNGRTVALDVPAMIVRGRTLVPLRFVSEAMGARVDWDAATRAVYIFSAQAGGPVTPLPPPPLQPPVVQPAPPSAIEGVVLRNDVDQSRIHVERDGRVHTFVVTGDTIIRLVDAGSGQARTITLAELPPDVPVAVTADAAGRATLVRVTVREVTGVIEASSQRVLALADGRTYTMTDDARVIVAGRASTRAQLQPGMAVTLWLNPQSGQVVLVRADQPVAQPGAAIVSVSVEPQAPLRAGDLLTVRMRGTPGGQAAFMIEGVTGWIAMAEAAGQATGGVYAGAYRIRTGDDAPGARVIVRLVRGDAVSRMEAPTRVTIGAAPGTPFVVITAPTSGSIVRAGWVIEGRAMPGARVVVRVDYRGRVLLFESRGTLGEFATTADASGRWAVRITREAPVADAELTVTATAFDAFNRQSDQAVIALRQG